LSNISLDRACAISRTLETEFRETACKPEVSAHFRYRKTSAAYTQPLLARMTSSSLRY
jgi:hypothetical protein